MSQENVAVVRRMVEEHWNTKNPGLSKSQFVWDKYALLQMGVLPMTDAAV